jgi:hypothetical protein
MRRATPILALAAALLASCGESAAPDDAVEAIRPPEIARIKAAKEVLDGAHIRTLDPGTMNDAQIAQAIGIGPRCEFRYTSAGGPVLAITMQPGGTPGRAVLKLNGDLVLLSPVSSGGPSEDVELAADPIRTRLAPASGGFVAGRQEAKMIFEIGDELRVGYGGFLGCTLP